jgi:hypothetical protein
MLTLLIVFYLLIGVIVGLAIATDNDSKAPNKAAFILTVAIAAVIWIPLVIAKKVLV